MEQHPVPQNVTTFQFRLIGDMTLKQFGYLIAGAILAFIAYKLPLPFIITWPLTGAFAFLGIGFAFIPVEERPMDVWVFSFFKSIYSPTQYIWSHETSSTPDASPSPSVIVPPTPSASLQTPISASQNVSTEPVAQKAVLSELFQQAPSTSSPQHATTKPTIVPAPRLSLLDELFAFFQPKRPPITVAPHAQNTPPVSIPSVTGFKPTEPLSTNSQTSTETVLHEKISRLEHTLKNLEEQLATKTITEDRVLALQKQLAEVLAQKNKTENEQNAHAHATNTTVSVKPPPSPEHSSPPNPVSPPMASVHGVVNVITTQEGAVKAGLPRLTNSPNVITGLVKDDAGNLLPGILVTVTNNEGIPVRALKTNKLGQFAASTPLSSGVYFVEIEDPRSRFTFSRVQITLNGAVVPILEIIAKSEKALTRERLAQEIFGKPTV